MKVLLIKGSLRGENSHSLMVARKFVEGICEETDSEVKEIYLGNTRIAVSYTHLTLPTSNHV